MHAKQVVQARFDQQLHRLIGLYPSKPIGLSISGGVDSMALGSFAQNWALERKIDLHAFVIDHGLRPGSAQEQALVVENLQKMGINAHKLTVDMSNVPMTRMERVARTKRQNVLRDACSSLGIEHLLYGHHKDDQYETFIMRSLQHSSWYGLAGMHPISLLDPTSLAPNQATPVKSVRPLLGFHKVELVEWCKSNSIKWFEDKTNQDASLTIRNAIRKLTTEYGELLPRHLQPAHVHLLQSELLERRTRADAEASALYRIYKTSGEIKLDYSRGTAKLDLTREFLQLSVDSQVSLLMKLLTFSTPLPVKELAYRRTVLRDFVEAKYAKKVVADVVLDVNTSQNQLVFKRSQSRRANQANRKSEDKTQIAIHVATHQWSEWTFVDNRFWMRWRLVKSQRADHRTFGIYMNHGEFIRQVQSELKHQVGTQLKFEDCTTQPLLAFTHEDESLLQIKPENIIGYPTLAAYQNLEVEWKYKQVYDVN